MHLKVVEAQEKLLAILTLIGSFAVVHFGGMFHYVLFSKHCDATDFAMILANRQAETTIMEHGAVSSIVQGMFKLKVTSSAF